MRMKPAAFAVIALAAAPLIQPAIAADAPPIAGVKAVASGYAKQLKGNLQDRMSKEGPQGAISVCSDKAAQIGSETARQTGWSIRRVTTKARNPLSMPDEYELKVLKEFEKELASGKKEDPARYETVTEDGVRYARFMKAIRIEPLCLACHGSSSEIAPDVAKRLFDLYPHDTAKNYKLDELRGALSIKIKLD